MNDRRRFLHAAGVLTLPAFAPGLARADDKSKKDEEEVTPAEDLMREHGILNRVLLVYEEGLRRLRVKEEVSPDVFHQAASLVRKFVEDYHENLEEKFLFPRFESRKRLTELVAVLRKQHQAGRALTDVVLREAAKDRFRNAENRATLVASVEAFIRMYRPHEAREDTVLFPALPKVFSAKELKELGERFEKEEDKLFGEEGFHKVVDRVAGFEKQLGIHYLDRFTPRLSGR
jgi:hemerythrin-like domain-containing protein